MLYLILGILCSALIGNLLILFNRKADVKIFQIFLGNYFLASIFSFFSKTEPLQQIDSFILVLGSITGLMFLLNFIVYKQNISFNGLSLSVSIMRISLIIPTFISVFIFFEYISLFNYFGIAIAIIAFIILGNKNSLHNFFWLLLLFFVTGITESLLKIYDEFGSHDESLFIFVLFFSAFIFNLIWLFIKKAKLHTASFLLGLILGIPNQLTTKFFLLALKEIPASLAFPISASGVVLLVILTDIILWKKKFSKKQKIALILLIVGIILLNLR